MRALCRIFLVFQIKTSGNRTVTGISAIHTAVIRNTRDDPFGYSHATAKPILIDAYYPENCNMMLLLESLPERKAAEAILRFG